MTKPREKTREELTAEIEESKKKIRQFENREKIINRPKDPKTARNKNVLVIGGSGSGKTRFFVKPNLMQCVSKDYPTSFVITDPNGNLQ